MAEAHSHRTPYQQRPPSNLINKEEHDGRENDEERILHTGRDQVDVALQIGHVEDVHHVVGHDICTRELLPRLDGETGECALPHAIVDELAPAGWGEAFGSEDSGYLLQFGDNVGVFFVASSLDVGEDAGAELESYLGLKSLRMRSY